MENIRLISLSFNNSHLDAIHSVKHATMRPIGRYGLFDKRPTITKDRNLIQKLNAWGQFVFILTDY